MYIKRGKNEVCWVGDVSEQKLKSTDFQTTWHLLCNISNLEIILVHNYEENLHLMYVNRSDSVDLVEC